MGQGERGRTWLAQLWLPTWPLDWVFLTRFHVGSNMNSVDPQSHK